MKVYDYIIVCKRPDFKLVDGISQLMLFLSLLVFSSSLSNPIGSTVGPVIQYIIIGCILSWWAYCYYRQRNAKPIFFRLALLLAAVGWYFQPGWRVVAIIYFLAAVLEKQVKFPQEIAFDEKEMVINSLPKKYYSWHELTNVLIKDGILTIDFSNNKLIQKEIETQTSLKIEEEFNEFCRNKINAKRLMQNA